MKWKSRDLLRVVFCSPFEEPVVMDLPTATVSEKMRELVGGFPVLVMDNRFNPYRAYVGDGRVSWESIKKFKGGVPFLVFSAETWTDLSCNDITIIFSMIENLRKENQQAM